MKPIANFLWIIFGGLILSLFWAMAGLIFCISIIGIPFGMQCFKFASLMLAPFGKEIIYANGIGSFILNIIWILFFGWELAILSLVIGVLWCLTIVGYPIGIQCIKFAKLSFMPFGAEIVNIE